MNQTPQTGTQTNVSPFIVVIFRFLDYIEIVGLLGAGVGFAMMYAQMDGAPEILMVALSVLASVFFLKGYTPQPASAQVEGEPKLGFIDLLAGKIVPQFAWIGCSVVTIGILFRLLNLEGGGEMLMIGCSVLTMALLLCGMFIVTKPERSSGLMPLVYRAVPLCLVGVYLFMTRTTG